MCVLRVSLNGGGSSAGLDEGGQCLEVAFASDDFGTDRAVHIRDSKNPTGPIFTVSPEAWAAFTDYATR